MKINIDDNCLTQFKEIKLNRKYRYITFKIQNEKVVVEHLGQRQQNWSQFVHTLPPAEYRFAVYDIEFKTNDGINASKLFFLSWLPDGAKIKIKMLYASGKESLKGYLDLNGKEINVSTVDQYTQAGVINQFNK